MCWRKQMKYDSRLLCNCKTIWTFDLVKSVLLTKLADVGNKVSSFCFAALGVYSNWSGNPELAWIDLAMTRLEFRFTMGLSDTSLGGRVVFSIKALPHALHEQRKGWEIFFFPFFFFFETFLCCFCWRVLIEAHSLQWVVGSSKFEIESLQWHI